MGLLILAILLGVMPAVAQTHARTTINTTTAGQAGKRILQFPASIAIGKVYALKKGWKYSDVRCEEKLVGPAVGALSVNTDQPLMLRLGYELAEHPELLSKVTPDAFVKVDSDNMEVEDSICKPISKLVSIIELGLKDSEITDKGVEQLAALPNIRALYIARINIRGSCLHALKGTKSLRSLALNNNAISPDKFKYFAELPALTKLWVEECGLNDEALKYIGQIKSLEGLALDKNAKLTNEGLKNLRELKHLHSLSISEGKLTVQGVEQLKGLPLTHLWVPKYLQNASARLQATFPHVKITFSSEGEVTPDEKKLCAPLK